MKLGTCALSSWASFTVAFMIVNEVGDMDGGAHFFARQELKYQHEAANLK
jgi:hypothetical protein